MQSNRRLSPRYFCQKVDTKNVDALALNLDIYFSANYRFTTMPMPAHTYHIACAGGPKQVDVWIRSQVRRHDDDQI